MTFNPIPRRPTPFTLPSIMPRGNVTPTEEIILFVMLAQSDRLTSKELCGQFCVRRKTLFAFRVFRVFRGEHSASVP